MKRIGMSLIWILIVAAVGSAQTTVYFPQVIGGLQGDVMWSTAFIVTNPAAVGSAAASGTITLTQDNGTAFNVAGNFVNAVTGQPAGTGNTFSFQISGGQTQFFVMDVMGEPLRSGFARLTSNLPVTATSLFLESQAATGEEIALAGVPATAALARQSALVARNQGVDIGIAYANPNTSPATVTFQLLNTSGVAFGSPATRTLAANNHTAVFVSELFPAMPAVFFGTMRITTDASTPLIATTLLFNAGGTFGTVPMIPLP